MIIVCCKIFSNFAINVTIYDPWANPEEVKHEYGLVTVKEMPEGKFEAAVVAVLHKEFENIQVDSRIVYTVKK
jgi:UDP-N-acetyl-D-galactosamine dehydrogenase